MGERFEELRRLLALTYSTASVEAVAREIAGGAPAGIEHRRNVGDMLETLAAIGEHTEQVLAALDAATAEVARLREAVEPVITDYEPWMDEFSDDAGCSVFRRFTFGDLRRACAALSPKEEGEP